MRGRGRERKEDRNKNFMARSRKKQWLRMMYTNIKKRY